MTTYAEEFALELESNIARSRAVQAAMDAEIAKREAIGVDLRELRDAQAEAMGVRFFAYSAREHDAERASWPKSSFDQPLISRKVWAVGRRGQTVKFLGYEDDPDTVGKILDLSDFWTVQYENVVEDSPSDELLGRAVSEPGSPERIAEEREAWDTYEWAKTHREEIALDRFEHKGSDARGGFADADEKGKRAHADRQLQMELERGAEVLGDEKHLGALKDRKRFRALVESFGQDPDAPEIKAWVSETIGHYVYKNGKQIPERRGYKRCIAALIAKAERDGVDVAA